MEKKEVSIIDYLYVLVKWRKFIFVNFIVVCIIAASVSLILPKWYKADTTILPPLEEAGEIGISSIISNLPIGGLGMGLGAISEEANLFLAIINSRTVIEAVAREFDLMKRYKTKNMEETVKALRKHVDADLNEEGTITLSTEAGTTYLATEKEENEARELAKNMANFFIVELDKVNKRLKVERARNTRVFIERRYLQNLEDLSKAEEEFKQFQQKYGMIALTEQTTATITAAAELKAQIHVKEVELGVLRKYVGSSHTDFIRTQNELNELRKKYNEFKYGKQGETLVGEDSTYSKDLFLPLEEVPDLGLQYARLFRNVTLQEKIREFLLPEYEQAKIQEARDTPTVQVLDEAVTPIKRSKPKRAFFVLTYGAISLFLSTVLVFFIEHINSLKIAEAERYRKIERILNELKKDVGRFLPKRWRGRK